MRVKWHFRKYLAARNLTIQDFAEKAGVHRNTVSRWRGNDYLPSIEDSMLARICVLLSISLEDLLELEVNEAEAEALTKN
ncbi:helix-turn-helix transcriptional regulator [Coleofasciculus sp. LEGE 07081]|uniref:helix-turn-helix domain-containing protein n=1 Tax=Coleofasciculus sp. LEGE 07081 TaxID=2777967 RepID=UPI001A06C321|nr:helix-turn-helix transcriptional regulator [Coleofasciculus sp. LEGE 07081]MBE9124727.1 helix-turn-helix transcriptional regulator [Coleofasciculus sp. LEGE 07081]